MEWDVAISWQLQVYMAITGCMWAVTGFIWQPYCIQAPCRSQSNPVIAHIDPKCDVQIVCEVALCGFNGTAVCEGATVAQFYF